MVEFERQRISPDISKPKKLALRLAGGVTVFVGLCGIASTADNLANNDREETSKNAIVTTALLSAGSYLLLNSVTERRKKAQLNEIQEQLDHRAELLSELETAIDTRGKIIDEQYEKRSTD